MSEFEEVLDECLLNLEQDGSSVDECLRYHPEHARELEPILLASAYLRRGGEARVSEAFKRRVRTRLLEQMDAHPRKRARFALPFMRLATGFLALLLSFLVTGTVLAQEALPGETLYGWKLASESTWRAVSPDPVGTDLAIAERRVDELIAVSDDPALYSQTLEAYLEVTSRLTSEIDDENAAHIVAALDSQIEELNESGILMPPPVPEQEILPPVDEPTPSPTGTPLPVLPTVPVETTTLPEVIPTLDIPEEPTGEEPPAILPTLQEPPKILPTIEIPPPIP